MTEDQYENFAAYVFTRNAKRHAGATDAEAHAAGVKALEESVWGVGFQRDRHGNPIQSGVGAWPHNVTANSLAAIRKYEGKEAWEKIIRKLWKEAPEVARKIGAPEPVRAGA